ncbi:MAG: hypothetical protein CSA35_05190 [Dethiosulfovibrio peptidovorans]|nr:MAG: hypothetical protein CSA35_05190 [Dethiosulfovibrio peptidovorans]
MKKRLVVFMFVVISAVSVVTAWGTERSFVGDVAASDRETRLFRWLVAMMSPEEARMILDEKVPNDGTVRHIYFEAVGPSLEGLRFSSISLEAAFSDFGPVEAWNDDGPKELRSVLRGYLDASISDSDLNQFLKGLVVEDDDGCWESMSVRFLPGGLSASGYYHVHRPVNLRIKVDLDGRLELREGAELWLDRYQFRINNDDQSSIVDKALQKTQPIVNMKDFVFPVHLNTLELQKGWMHLATWTVPKPFDGLAYSYRSK